MLRAKQNLFEDLSGNDWRVKYSGNLPQHHTLRDFTVAEKESDDNAHLLGVRTYFFHANHWRGLPKLTVESDDHPYDDFAWVPKRKLNEFFTREYHEIFIDGTTTR